jgi:uncharacterized protein with HEPN domain
MRHDSAYLHDALRAIEELKEFLGQTSREQFLSSRLEQSFVCHRLVILGEAAATLALLWSLASTHLDELRQRLEAILKAEFPEDTR